VPPGPPPLRPFGLVLHHDGRWSHEGIPLLNRKLRAAFDKAVRFLPDEGKYVVQLGQFRGEIELQESGFFVRSFHPDSGSLRLSDGSEEVLEPASLRVSPIDGALLCTVKRGLVEGGLPARFDHSAHADLLLDVEEDEDGLRMRLAGRWVPVPAL